NARVFGRICGGRYAARDAGFIAGEFGRGIFPWVTPEPGNRSRGTLLRIWRGRRECLLSRHLRVHRHGIIGARRVCDSADAARTPTIERGVRAVRFGARSGRVTLLRRPRSGYNPRDSWGASWVSTATTTALTTILSIAPCT